MILFLSKVQIPVLWGGGGGGIRTHTLRVLDFVLY